MKYLKKFENISNNELKVLNDVFFHTFDDKYPEFPSGLHLSLNLIFYKPEIILKCYIVEYDVNYNGYKYTSDMLPTIYYNCRLYKNSINNLFVKLCNRLHLEVLESIEMILVDDFNFEYGSLDFGPKCLNRSFRSKEEYLNCIEYIVDKLEQYQK